MKRRIIRISSCLLSALLVQLILITPLQSQQTDEKHQTEELIKVFPNEKVVVAESNVIYTIEKNKLGVPVSVTEKSGRQVHCAAAQGACR